MLNSNTLSGWENCVACVVVVVVVAVAVAAAAAVAVVVGFEEIERKCNRRDLNLQ